MEKLLVAEKWPPKTTGFIRTLDLKTLHTRRQNKKIVSCGFSYFGFSYEVWTIDGDLNPPGFPRADSHGLYSSASSHPSPASVPASAGGSWSFASNSCLHFHGCGCSMAVLSN